MATAAAVEPPLHYLAGRLDLGSTKLWMAAAALVWLCATPLWMEQEKGGA